MLAITRGPSMKPVWAATNSSAPSDASVAIKDGEPSSVSLPHRIDDVDVSAQFEYAPVHYSLTLDHVSFRGSSPNVAVRQLTGKLAVRDDNLYMDRVTLNTGETFTVWKFVVRGHKHPLRRRNSPDRPFHWPQLAAEIY